MTSRPLTYAETVKADPFIRKLDNGVTLHINQWGALEAMDISIEHKRLEKHKELISKGVAVRMNAMEIFNTIANYIYKHTKKPRLFKKRFKKRFYDWAFKNTGQMYSIWEDLYKSSTCTFFFDRPPSELTNGAGRKVSKDWFGEYCGDYDPRTTSWLFIRQKREVEKAKAIEKFYAQKQANK